MSSFPFFFNEKVGNKKLALTISLTYKICYRDIYQIIMLYSKRFIHSLFLHKYKYETI